MLNLGKYAKFIVAAVGAAVIGVGIAIGEDSSTYQIIVSVLTALGVYTVPNRTA